jgi:hypothetical protein
MLSDPANHSNEIESLRVAIANFRSHRPHRHFSDDIRNETLRLLSCGVQLTTLSNSLHLPKSVIYKWKRQKASTNNALQDTVPPRVFSVRDEDAACEPKAVKESQTLSLQIGAFDITVSLRMESR